MSRLVVYRQFAGRHVLERGVLRVLWGDNRVNNAPLDPDLGVIPEDAAAISGIVEVAALVEKMHGGSESQEAVRESDGDVYLIVLFGGEDYADPLAEMRGAAAYVHDDIKRFACDHAAQFGLGPVQLVVEPAYDVERGTRVTVLNEAIVNSQGVELPFVIALEVKTARVVEHSGPDEADARQRGFRAFKALGELQDERLLFSGRWNPASRAACGSSSDRTGCFPSSCR